MKAQPSKGVDSAPTYISIFKVQHDEPSGGPPASVRLLEEATSFVLLEELSLHLSGYFNGRESDEFITELRREDIPNVLLQNRVLNLLSTPIEQRDIFLAAFPKKDERPEGVLYSLWGSDGSMYSRFDLVVPKKTSLRYPERGTFKLETPRLEVTLRAEYTGSTAVVSNAFLLQYARLHPRRTECRHVAVTLSCRIKATSLLTSKGWEYYKWLDSFRRTLRSKVDFESFQEDIKWSTIEPLLYCLRDKKPSGPRQPPSQRDA